MYNKSNRLLLSRIPTVFYLIISKRTHSRGNNISTLLRDMEESDTDNWKPSLSVSTKSDIGEKSRENHQFELDYKVDYDEYMKRK